MPARGVPPTGDPALKTAARKALVVAVRAEAIEQGRGCEISVCLMPSRAIDWRATRGPWRYVLDEITPRALGGDPADPGNVRPAHHRCNSVAGARLGHQLARARRAVLEDAGLVRPRSYSNPAY